MNTSHYNSVQELNLERARLKVPLMHFGECLHGVGSFNQSMFPQSIGMSATFDKDLIYRVGRAIGTEARSIGIHACFSPVLDICQDPRWGRRQGLSPSMALEVQSLKKSRGLGRRQGTYVPNGSRLRVRFVKERHMAGS